MNVTHFFGNTGSLLSYIDGGSASMFFQALIGGLLATVYFASTRARIVAAWFRNVLRTK